MATRTVRINEQTHDLLKELASERGEHMQDVLADAVREYRRNHFFDVLDAAYERLARDPRASAEYRQEIAELEGTMMDGLSDL